MSLNVIQLVHSSATSSIAYCLYFSYLLRHTHTHLQMLAPILCPHSNERTLIHLRLTNLMQRKRSAQLIRPLLHHFPTSSSVHHSEGTKPPSCMYALIDLTETENVMFHSGALLTDWLSVTRVVRQLQSRVMV